MSDLASSAIIPKSRVDTNIVLRFLVGDGEDHAEKARILFKRASDGEEALVLCDTVFIESVVVFVFNAK